MMIAFSTAGLAVVSIPFCIPLGVTATLGLEGILFFITCFGFLLYVILTGGDGMNIERCTRNLSQKQIIVISMVLLTFVFYLISLIALT